MVLQKQKTKKYLVLNVIYFIFFFVLYTLLDSFNLSYSTMQQTYGSWLVIINVILNLIMASLSALMLGFTSAQFDFSKKESRAYHVSYLSLLWGVLTYGCTPCVISFFAAIGISFSVMVLPFAGLPYKLISLLVLILGFLWILRVLSKTTCPINPTITHNDQGD
jgi:MFS family permease